MSALYRNVVFPAWHALRRDGLNRARRELDRGQWLPAAEIRRLQLGKLARLLAFAGRHVPHYRPLLGRLDAAVDGATALAALATLPPLTKQLIREDLRSLTSENLEGNRLRPNSTSGSTGEATRFFTDAWSFAARRAAEIRSNSWTGYRLGERDVALWGAPMDLKKSASLRGRAHALFTHHRSLSSYDLSSSTMDTYVDLLRNFAPALMIGYPGPLEVFARHCQDRGVAFPSLKGIVTSAETLWPHQRQVIEGAFGVRVFDRYGSREFGQTAAECEVHDGLHLSAERVLVEVVDDDGRPCGPLKEGRLLVTDLDNYGMPFIRYDIGDRGLWAAAGDCACGRGLPRLQKIVGRTLDVVETPSGLKIGGTFWTLLLRSRSGIRQFQVVQNERAGIVVRYVREPGLTPETLGYFESRIREHCGAGFRVHFEECQSIELTASGKQRLIVSNLGRPHVPGEP